MTSSPPTACCRGAQARSRRASSTSASPRPCTPTRPRGSRARRTRSRRSRSSVRRPNRSVGCAPGHGRMSTASASCSARCSRGARPTRARTRWRSPSPPSASGPTPAALGVDVGRDDPRRPPEHLVRPLGGERRGRQRRRLRRCHRWRVERGRGVRVPGRRERARDVGRGNAPRPGGEAGSAPRWRARATSTSAPPSAACVRARGLHAPAFSSASGPREA